MNVAFDHSAGNDQSLTDTIPNIAKRFKARNEPWALVVDDNYGEGSAREHAALQPRFYGTLIPLCGDRLLTSPRLRFDCRQVFRSHPRNEFEGMSCLRPLACL